MRDLVFACLLGRGEAEKEALRLARSIRTLGGEFCFNPIWMLTQQKEADLPQPVLQELYSLGVRLIEFEMPAEAAKFPFASYVTAAGIAEMLAQGETSFLAMLASDTLVLQSPVGWLLPAGKSLGACPVHLKILGTAVDAPIDEFWSLVYRHSEVDVSSIFPMRTIVDSQLIRAYFNAGLLVVRPERGLLRAWQADFDALYQLPDFTAYYQQDELYTIFMHQVVLAGSVLSLIKPDEFQQMPFEMNYPLHLHTRVSPTRRPVELGQLITCRYEDYNEFFANPSLDRVIHIEPSLKSWLLSQLS